MSAIQVIRVVGRPQQITVRAERQNVRIIGTGRPGKAGTASGALTLQKIASGTLSGHRIVRNVDATRVGYVDATDASNGDDVLGMTLGSALDGAPVTVMIDGEITEPGWSWVPLDPIFVTGLGMLTQTPPDDMAFVLQVGYAISTTAARISIRDTIYF